MKFSFTIPTDTELDQLGVSNSERKALKVLSHLNGSISVTIKKEGNVITLSSDGEAMFDLLKFMLQMRAEMAEDLSKAEEALRAAASKKEV